MKISELWLREWANPDLDSKALVEQLTMAGLEVDSVEPCAPALDKVVVGRVLEKNLHPNADKLSVCLVDIGADAPVQIVCGATNVAAGGTYPVACIGAVLPGDFRIKRSKLRGEESLGMLCSGVELGIAEQADGLLELDDSLAPGTPVSTALNLEDRIIDLDLTPNRADCFSVVGAARDIAAVNALEFVEPVVATQPVTSSDTLAISLDAGDACPAFAGRIIRNVDAAAETPLWMAEKLRRSGIRPLQPIVDVSNYVMLELGQPMHAYDLQKLQGGLAARMATSGEKITLLDDQELTLQDDVLVIADKQNAVALAGIMGGAATAVTDATRDIFLESAFFSPAAMAGRARRYGLHTDASLRFERGVDFTGQVRAIERATQLLLQIVGGAAGPLTEQRNASALPGRTPVDLRRAKLQTMLGIAIPDGDVSAMLERLGFAVASTPAGWAAVPPAWRFDIAIEEDLVEEVVRLYGYDQVPEIAQQTKAVLSRVTETRVPAQRACTLLTDRGYQEVINYSFVDPLLQEALLGAADEMLLANPISRDQSVMRRSLWTGLLQVASLNRKRQRSRVRIFESGAVFSQNDGQAVETDVIAGLVWGGLNPEHWDSVATSADIFDIKSDLEALIALTGAAASFEFANADHPALRPGKTAQLKRAGAVVGWCGELHPRLARKWGLSPAPLLFEFEVAAGLAACVPGFRGVSRYPSVRRDLAVLVEQDVSAAQLIAAAKDAGGEILRDVRVFDVYTGERIETSLKSVALGLILQETSRTLTELEIDSVITAVVERFSGEFNAKIRE
jgi:phenylalanyl-tRNA synthetase beta chain